LNAVAHAADLQPPRASVSGEVVDPAMAAMRGVELVLMDEATSATRTTRTDDGGRFGFPGLGPGFYRLQVAHPGYGPFVARIALAIERGGCLRVARARHSV